MIKPKKDTPTGRILALICATPIHFHTHPKRPHA